MPMMYKENNVFDEAIERINMIFDYNDDIIVAMSGGKDSTVAFHLTYNIAKERGRLPIKVFWLDQEAEWQHTVDYMDKIMRMPGVKPYWFQIPFDFPNNLSIAGGRETLLIWDPEEKDKWVHPQSDIAITESPVDISQNRDKAFYTLMNLLPDYCIEPDTESYAVISGMRIAESPARRTAISYGPAYFRGETWSRGTGKLEKGQVFWPIYDFTNDDVWTAIAKNNWEYNPVYDLMYQYGVRKDRLRVSALIHETAFSSIKMLQEFEPRTYDRFVRRVTGTSSMKHAFDSGEVMPSKLPFMFKDWKEYRDYLLVHIIEPKYWEHYRKEWEGQEGDEWYNTHVCELIINDTCGTLNSNKRSGIQIRERAKSGYYGDKELDRFLELNKEGMADVYKGTAD